MTGHIELKGQQVRDILSGAASRHLPANIALQQQNRWLSFRSRFLAINDTELLLEMPVGIEEGCPPEKVLPGAECNISVRVQSYRFFFTAPLGSPVGWNDGNGSTVQALPTKLPATMSRCERRASPRVDIPSDKLVRAAIWAGVEQKPVWSGRVLNLSLTGLQLRTPLAAVSFFDPGDTINIYLVFGDSEKLLVEGHYRHGVMDGNMALVGIEFVPMHTTEAGRTALSAIAKKIAELSK